MKPNIENEIAGKVHKLKGTIKEKVGQPTRFEFRRPGGPPHFPGDTMLRETTADIGSHQDTLGGCFAFSSGRMLILAGMQLVPMHWNRKMPD
jgi:hypothetical protein